jgi:2-amino-4-hydroxy-6-hydroxymethyldihydropteridine diphosphokinase
VTAPAAFLGLGSNQGDRPALLAEAVGRLRRAPEVEIAAVSSLYATAPVGVQDQPEFLNAVVEVRTTLPPPGLLALCQGIEAALGRVRTQRWGPRTIDLDILLYGDLEWAADGLELPHPRMRERAFVLLPLAEVAPGLRLGGRSIADWAAAADASGVRRLDGGEWAGQGGAHCEIKRPGF